MVLCLGSFESACDSLQCADSLTYSITSAMTQLGKKGRLLRCHGNHKEGRALNSLCVPLLQEVTIQYNLCNEPWLKFSMAAVADRGLRHSQWTSGRLHRCL